MHSRRAAAKVALATAAVTTRAAASAAAVTGGAAAVVALRVAGALLLAGGAALGALLLEVGHALLRATRRDDGGAASSPRDAGGRRGGGGGGGGSPPSAASVLAMAAVIAFGAGAAVGTVLAAGVAADDGAPPRPYYAAVPYASSGGGVGGSAAAARGVAIPPLHRVSCAALKARRNALAEYLYARRLYLKLGHQDAETLMPALAGLDAGAPAAPTRYVDVGANVGQTSGAIMAHVCGAGGAMGVCDEASACTRRNTGVLAFEPQSRPRTRLLAEAASGRWALCGWHLRPQAVAASPGRMLLYGNDTQASLAMGGTRGTGGSRQPEEVEVTTLDDALREEGWLPGPPGSIFLLKIDAEGFDPYVLDGAVATLSAGLPRMLLFEYNSKWAQTGMEAADAPAAAAAAAAAAAEAGAEPDEARAGSGPFTAHAGPPSLRGVTRPLFERFGYACYLLTPDTLIPVSGAWWSPAFEFRRWSNILCMAEADVPLIELVLARTHHLAGTPPVPPVSRCFVNASASDGDEDGRASGAGGGLRGGAGGGGSGGGERDTAPAAPMRASAAALGEDLDAGALRKAAREREQELDRAAGVVSPASEDGSDPASDPTESEAADPLQVVVRRRQPPAM